MKEDILSTEEYLSQLDESNVILFFKEHIENLCHTVFKLIHQLRSYWKYNQKTVSESDCIAQCMLQMGLLRTKSILNLLKGQSLLENSNLLIQDIPSILSVLRSYYELCFTFQYKTPCSDAICSTGSILYPRSLTSLCKSLNGSPFLAVLIPRTFSKTNISGLYRFRNST